MIKVNDITDVNAEDTGRMSTAHSNLDVSADIESHFLFQSSTYLLKEDHKQEPPRTWWENTLKLIEISEEK